MATSDNPLLDMTDAIKAFQFDSNHRMRIRIGINSGLASVGNFGSRERSFVPSTGWQPILWSV